MKERPVGNVDIAQYHSENDNPVLGINFTLLRMYQIVRSDTQTYADITDLQGSAIRLLNELYLPETELRALHPLQPRLNEGQGRSLVNLLRKISRAGEQIET